MADRPNVEEVFEAWAHVAARVRKRSRDEQQQILADLGIGAEWDSVHETWSKRLNEDIVAKRMERPQRYAQICREEQIRRQRSSASPVASPAPVVPPGAVPPGAVPPAAVPPGAAPPGVMPPVAIPPAAGAQPAAAAPPPGVVVSGDGVPIPPGLAVPTANVQLGVSSGPRLGLPLSSTPLQAPGKPMRRRAETLDLKEPPTGDAIPFGKAQRQPATTVDFRDMVTPQRVKPAHPWMMQEKTVGAISGAATDVGRDAGQRRGGGASPDFRADIGGNRPLPPRPNQDDTASGVDLAGTVEAARQVSEVMTWTVERWARVCVALERNPQNADAIWAEQGITRAEARDHAARQWQAKLNKEPSVKAEMMGHLSRFRAMP